ncbi:hypothetical protein ACLOJK_022607 [Asimina triloba]
MLGCALTHPLHGHVVHLHIHEKEKDEEKEGGVLKVSWLDDDRHDHYALFHQMGMEGLSIQMEIKETELEMHGRGSETS